MDSNGKKRVFIVDAEPVVRLGLMQVIRDHKGLAVGGEAESLPMAREGCIKAKPDIVVLDPAMGDGIAFIKELPKWSPGGKVVVFTGMLDALTVQRAFKSGASGYVAKRDPLSALVVALVGASRGERHMGPLVEHVLLDTLACGNLEMRGDRESVLSNREREVLRLIGQGHSTRAVSEELRLCVKTVETHCKRIKQKLNLESASALRRHAAIHTAHNGNGGSREDRASLFPHDVHSDLIGGRPES